MDLKMKYRIGFGFEKPTVNPFISAGHFGSERFPNVRFPIVHA